VERLDAIVDELELAVLPLRDCGLRRILLVTKPASAAGWN
jgi:hypothetical protein